MINSDFITLHLKISFNDLQHERDLSEKIVNIISNNLIRESNEVENIEVTYLSTNFKVNNKLLDTNIKKLKKSEKHDKIKEVIK